LAPRIGTEVSFMLSRVRLTRRLVLTLETLEDRLVLSGDLTIPLDPGKDQFGDQIVTVQGYHDGSRTAYGIFDTGASAITFSASDQALFTARGLPIPIKVPDGAVASGVGGRVVGDVSMPDVVFADGLHAAKLSYGPGGVPTFQAAFGPTSAAVANVQALVGTEDGSPHLPTITGTPILAPSAAGGARSALIEMEGASFDFSGLVPGASASMPDLSFQKPGYNLTARSGTTDPVHIALQLQGPDNHDNPGRQITETPNPVQTAVRITRATVTLGNRHFLFDTGAQMSVISPGLAAALGLDASGAVSSTSLQGVAAYADSPMYVLDELAVPDDGGWVHFTNAPVFVADVGNGLDGVLGMNLFNSAVAMLYDPYGSGGLTVLFKNPPTDHGPSVGTGLGTALQGAGVPFANTFAGTDLPAFAVASGQISGQVFMDYNGDGRPTGNEGPLPGVTLYLDANGNGVLDNGEVTTATDDQGNYSFSGLAPGDYTVREAVPAGLIVLSPTGRAYQVTVTNGGSSDGWDFANVDRSYNDQSAYVAGLYGTLLDRAPDNAGLNSWLAGLYQGVSRDQVADAIWQSAEHRGLEVDRYYAVYLNRPADAAGRANWVNAFLHGASETQVQAGFVLSAEFQAANASNAAFVGSLYVSILGRTPDVDGQAHWLQALQGGARRDQVALGILTSGEAYQRVLDRYYTDFLHRAPDPAGEQSWLNSLLTDRYSPESAGVGFLVSGEFISRQRARIAPLTR
jgi:Domain of unknown function (DUF4214)/SdrD B-like domain/Aspartyl protease